MILADSNIVIYSRQAGYDKLRDKLSQQAVTVCAVTKIEVLGWHLMETHDDEAFRYFFEQAHTYDLDETVIEQTIKLKRLKPRMGLGDAIIAATAVAHGLQLWTANTKDFAEIKGLKLVNPLA